MTLKPSRTQLINLYTKGLEFLKQGLYNKALRCFNEIIKAIPERSHSYITRGFTYYKLNNLLCALSDYDQALKLDPKSKDALLNRANLYFKIKDYENSKRDYNMALKLDPNDVRGNVGIGLIKARDGDYEGAIAEFNTAIKAGNKHALYLRCFAYSHNGEFTNSTNDIVSISNSGVSIDADDSRKLFQLYKDNIRKSTLYLVPKI